MTTNQVISLAASIGACLSVIAAFFAIYFYSKHSKKSYKPELVVARTHFKFTDSSDTPYKLLNLNKPKSKDKNTSKTMLSVPLLNIGLGVAKEVDINWSFPIEDLVSKVNKLAKKTLIPTYFEYKNDNLSLEMDSDHHSTSFSKNKQDETIDFVIPALVDQTPYELVLPLAYTRLVSALVYLSTKSSNWIFLDSFPDIIPPLRDC